MADDECINGIAEVHEKCGETKASRVQVQAPIRQADCGPRGVHVQRPDWSN